MCETRLFTAFEWTNIFVFIYFCLFQYSRSSPTFCFRLPVSSGISPSVFFLTCWSNSLAIPLIFSNSLLFWLLLANFFALLFELPNQPETKRSSSERRSRDKKTVQTMLKPICLIVTIDSWLSNTRLYDLVSFFYQLIVDDWSTNCAQFNKFHKGEWFKWWSRRHWCEDPSISFLINCSNIYTTFSLLCGLWISSMWPEIFWVSTQMSNICDNFFFFFFLDVNEFVFCVEKGIAWYWLLIANVLHPRTRVPWM